MVVMSTNALHEVYIYIYGCVCVCVLVYWQGLQPNGIPRAEVSPQSHGLGANEKKDKKEVHHFAELCSWVLFSESLQAAMTTAVVWGVV